MISHESCHHGAYRLTCEEYDALWERAEGNCEICKVPAAGAARGKLYIDHDHAYGYAAVRGLLCAACNSLMRSVDHGRITDRRASAYRENAWFMRVVQGRDLTGQTQPKTPRPKTQLRPFRLSDELWDDVKSVARERGTTASAIVREILETYAKGA